VTHRLFMKSFKEQLGVYEIFRAFEKKTLSLLVVLLLSQGVHADLLFVSSSDFKNPTQLHDFSDLEAQNTVTTRRAPPLTVPEFEPSRLLPDPRYDLDQPIHVPPIQIGADSGQSSLSLCLSALMGLGLYSSAHSLKRLSLGLIPQSYHNAGPVQIGHSIAVHPDSVCPIPVCCFVQPVPGAEDIIPHYHFGTVTSIWRKSQFTPDAIASRGPPVTC
jgi:hypothetical protein